MRCPLVGIAGQDSGEMNGRNVLQACRQSTLETREIEMTPRDPSLLIAANAGGGFVTPYVLIIPVIVIGLLALGAVSVVLALRQMRRSRELLHTERLTHLRQSESRTSFVCGSYDVDAACWHYVTNSGQVL